MAPLQKKSAQHKHPLTVYDGNTEYLCEACMSPGTGKRYHCYQHDCNFNMHEYCYDCPMLLFSFLHTLHPLKHHSDDGQIHRICDVCRDPIEGLSYRCKDCEFDVHPICTQLPQTLHHVLHKAHPLRLLMGGCTASKCGVCGGTIDLGSWRYRCGICEEADIHIGCVSVPCEEQTIKWNPLRRFKPSSSNTHQYHHYNCVSPRERIGLLVFEVVMKALVTGVIYGLL